MPININSLSGEDLQYALNCMDVCDLIAFSLCSKRTEILAKSSKQKINPPSVDAFENSILFKIITSEFQELQDDSYQDDWDQYDPDIEDDVDNKFIFLDLSDSFINIDRGNGTEVWRKSEFTQSHWIAHLLSIFNFSMIHKLEIENVNLSYLDTIKQYIQKCQKLKISVFCSNNVARMAFLKLAPISEEVEVEKDIFDDENDISELLTLNLKSAKFEEPGFPFKLSLDDLLILNITDLTIETADINEKELNRFLKLWMKGSHRFYRPKFIEFLLMHDMNRDEVLRGLKHQTVNGELQLERADGKKVVISFGYTSWILEFRD